MQENLAKEVLGFGYFNDDFFDDIAISEYGFEECFPGKVVPWAKKEYTVIHLILKGKGIFKTNNKTYKLKQNDMFCEFRDNSIEYVADEKEPWHYVWIGISGKKSLELLHSVGLWEDNPVVRQVGEEIAELFTAIRAEMDLKGKVNLKIYGLLFNLLHELQEHNNKSDKPLSSQEIFVRKACVYIYHNALIDPNVENVAAQVHVTPNYLCRLFKKYLGCTVKDYIIHRRILAAKDYLQKTDLQIREIAKIVGYTNSATFVKIFKKNTGFAPEEYRKAWRDIENVQSE